GHGHDHDEEYGDRDRRTQPAATLLSGVDVVLGLVLVGERPERVARVAGPAGGGVDAPSRGGVRPPGTSGRVVTGAVAARRVARAGLGRQGRLRGHRYATLGGGGQGALRRVLERRRWRGLPLRCAE